MSKVASSDFSVGVDGGYLRGQTSGSGDPVLVLHGGPGLSDYSELFLDELAGWQALRYTQRGPQPSAVAGPYSVAVHVADALAVLEHHEIDRAVVLGHSWGSFLACCLVAEAPNRISGLVLVDGLGLVDDGGMAAFSTKMSAGIPPESAARVVELDEQALNGEGSEDDALESLRLVWPAYFADPAGAPQMPDDLRLCVASYAETFESVQEVQRTGTVAAALAGFGGPVEIVYGEASPMPATASTQTAALFGDAVVTTTPAAGHFPWLEQPGAIHRALARLATRLGPGG